MLTSMEKIYIVIINPHCRQSETVIKFFRNKKIKYLLPRTKHQLKKTLKNKIKQKYHDFIVCGGDGTINTFINTYMKLSKKKRNKIRIAFLPCGTANDFTRELQIPANIGKAYSKILNSKTKKIDLIKVNHKYFITGGGFGSVTEINKEVNDIFSLLNKNSSDQKIGKALKEHLFYFSIIKKTIFGFKGTKSIKINEDFNEEGPFMSVFVQNQSTIGKKFKISPNSKNTDGFFEICLLKKDKISLVNINSLYQILNGYTLKSKNTHFIKTKKVVIKIKEKEKFIGDGEVIAYSKKFKIKIVPKAINVYC